MPASFSAEMGGLSAPLQPMPKALTAHTVEPDSSVDAPLRSLASRQRLTRPLFSSLTSSTLPLSLARPSLVSLSRARTRRLARVLSR
eukprot:4004773-Pleurochrysis_carterae.AAC.1